MVVIDRIECIGGQGGVDECVGEVAKLLLPGGDLALVGRGHVNVRKLASSQSFASVPEIRCYALAVSYPLPIAISNFVGYPISYSSNVS